MVKKIICLILSLSLFFMYEINVSAAADKLSLSEITLTDTNDFPIKKVIPNERVRAHLNVSNNSNYEESLILVIASYNENSMLCLDTLKCVIPNNSSKNFVLDSKPVPTKADKVKAFAVKDLSDVKPLLSSPVVLTSQYEKNIYIINEDFENYNEGFNKTTVKSFDTKNNYTDFDNFEIISDSSKKSNVLKMNSNNLTSVGAKADSKLGIIFDTPVTTNSNEYIIIDFDLRATASNDLSRLFFKISELNTKDGIVNPCVNPFLIVRGSASTSFNATAYKDGTTSMANTTPSYANQTVSAGSWASVKVIIKADGSNDATAKILVNNNPITADFNTISKGVNKLGAFSFAFTDGGYGRNIFMDNLKIYKVPQNITVHTAAVNGSIIGEKSHCVPYLSDVTVSASGVMSHPFLGWYEASTNTLVSTQRTYTFYPTENINLVAKFGDEAIYTDEIMQAPQGAKAILSIVRDDAYVQSAIEYEKLNEKYDLCASAAATIGNEYTGVEGVIRNLSIWQRLVNNGRLSILNHSYNHGWDPNKGFTETPYHAIVDSKNKLKELFPGQEVVSFIEPGGSYMNDESEELIKNNFIALRRSRRGLNSFNPPDWYDIALYGIGTDKQYTSYYNDPDIIDSVSGISDDSDYAKDAISGIKDAVKNGGWLTQMWHGIVDADSDTYAPITTEQADAILKYAGEKKKSGELSVMFFTDAVKYLKEYQDSTLTKISSDNSKRILTLSSSGALDETITKYDYPLCIKSSLPIEWEAVKVTQNGKSTVYNAITTDDEHFVYFDAIPDGSDIEIEPSGKETSSCLISLSYETEDGNIHNITDFDKNTTVYTVKTQKEVKETVKVSAQAEDQENAALTMTSPDGTVELIPGKTTQIFITVNPLRGKPKKYRIDFETERIKTIDPDVIFEDDFEDYLNGGINLTKWNSSYGGSKLGALPQNFNILSTKDNNNEDTKALNMVAGSGTSAVVYDTGDENVLYTNDNEVITVEFDYRAGLWTGASNNEPTNTSGAKQTSAASGTRFVAGNSSATDTSSFARIANITAPTTPVQPHLYVTPNGAAASESLDNINIDDDIKWHSLKAVFKAPEASPVTYDLYVDGVKINSQTATLSENPGLQKFMLANTRYSTNIRKINMVDNYKIKKFIPDTTLKSLKYKINNNEYIDVPDLDSTLDSGAYNIILPETVSDGDIITLSAEANNSKSEILYHHTVMDDSGKATAFLTVDNMAVHKVNFTVKSSNSSVIFSDDFEDYSVGSLGLQTANSPHWNFSIGNGALNSAPRLFNIESVSGAKNKTTKALNMLASSGASAVGKDFGDNGILYTAENEAISLELDFRVGPLTKSDGATPGDAQTTTSAGTRFTAGNSSSKDTDSFVRIANIKKATDTPEQPYLFVTPYGAAANDTQDKIKIENSTAWHHLKVLFYAPKNAGVTYDVYVDNIKINSSLAVLSDNPGLQKFMAVNTRYSTTYRAINYIDNFTIRKINITQ